MHTTTTAHGAAAAQECECECECVHRLRQKKRQALRFVLCFLSELLQQGRAVAVAQVVHTCDQASMGLLSSGVPVSRKARLAPRTTLPTKRDLQHDNSMTAQALRL
jgi:hypothetical protein